MKGRTEGRKGGRKKGRGVTSVSLLPFLHVHVTFLQVNGREHAVATFRGPGGRDMTAGDLLSGCFQFISKLVECVGE